MGVHGPPQLGNDDVIRYAGVAHFLEDFRENLVKGRVFARTKRSFKLRTTLRLAIEGPGVEWSVGADALVLNARDGLIGVELLEFEELVRPTLELLLEEVQQNQGRSSGGAIPVMRAARPRDDKTIVGGLPQSLAPAPAGPSTNVGPAPFSEETADIGVVSRERPSREPELPTVPPARPDELANPRGSRPSLRPQTAARRPDSESDDSGFRPILQRPPPPAAEQDPDEDSIDGDMIADLAPPEAPPRLSRPPARASATSAAITPPVLEEPVPFVAPEPPPPPPAIEASGVEAFEKLPGLRATSGGVVRVTDPVQLLAAYLGSIRHGALALHGGPAGDVGQGVTIKLAGPRVVSVAAEITARIGGWVYLSIPDPAEIAGFLRDLAPEWLSALEPLGAGKAQASPPVIAAVVAPPAPVIAPPAPPSEPPTPSAPPTAPSLSAPAPEPPKPVSFDEPGAPQPGRLEADAIVFRGPKDLVHELTTNLKNGGLIASSSPIAIRTHKSLRVVLGALDTQVRIEADVVYAAGGKVGFAVTGFADVTSALEKRLKQGFTSTPSIAAPAAPAPVLSAPPLGLASISPGTIGAGPSMPPASLAPPASDAPVDVSGRINGTLSPSDLLDFPTLRVQSEEDLDGAAPLLVFELVTRRRLRGILNLRKNDETVSIYVHEGSVAFVDARPWNEEHALGRLFVQSKKLAEPQLREGLERSKKDRKPLGKILVALGHVNANALVLALREQSRLKIEPTLAWGMGSFDFQPWQDPPIRADLVLASGLGVQVKYLRHLYEQLTTNAVEELLAPNLMRAVQLTGEVDPTAAVFGFQPKELRFLQGWIDGKRDLSTTLTGSPIGRLASLRLVAFGLSMNLLRFADGKRASLPRGQQQRKPTDAAGFGALKRSLEEDLRIMRGQSYFELLGIHWSAHHRTYGEAYRKARAKFDVTRGELRDAPPAIQAIAKEAALLVENAYKKLTNDEERVQYRKKLFDHSEREMGAEMLIKQGEVMSLRGDRVGAIEALETAVELSPTQKNKALLAQARER